MHALTPLTLPDVLVIYRHDQGLTRTQLAREAGMCPHCYEKLEAGRGAICRQALEKLYIRLPVVAALMTDMAFPVPAESRHVVRRLQTLITAFERLDADSQAVALTRIRLEMRWQESPSVPHLPETTRHAAASPGPEANTP